MLLKRWEDIPDFMRTDEVRVYYDILKSKRWQLFIKRLMDIVLAAVLLVILAIPMIIIGIMIKIDSPGSIMFRQERVTSYGRVFKIHKFRTMVANASEIGTAVTVASDARVTRVGSLLRGLRLDELPQLIDVIVGDMTFVGTRAEVPKYVQKYTNEMKATLLLPAGITSIASIRFKDEADQLEAADDVDKVYMESVLPLKMKINLDSLKEFSILGDLAVMIQTVMLVAGRQK